MNENLKKFLEEASKNEELKAKLAALTDKETAVAKAIELAKEYGFTLTAEDFQPADGAELSLDELDQVAGGYEYLPGLRRYAHCYLCEMDVWGSEAGQPCPRCGTPLEWRYKITK